MCLLAEGHLLIEDVPGRRQDEPGQGAGGVDRLQLEAGPVHPRPAARRPRRRQHLPALERAVPLPAGPAVRQHRAGRRDQPGLAEDAVGAARGDGGAPDHRRRRRPGRWRRRSWSSPPRTRSTRRAPTGCPRASSTASCCASRSATRAGPPSCRSSTGAGAVESLPKLAPVVSAAEVMTMIEAVRSVFLADALKAYLVDLAEASRRHPAIELGLSPRATLQLAAASRAHAAARGRRYATPDDVKAMAVPGAQPPPAAAHRPRRPARSRRRHRRDPRRRPRADVALIADAGAR